MAESRLTQIATEMLKYAREHKYDPAGTPVPFQRQLGHGLRLTCYVRDGQFVLDMERRFNNLENGEAHITRLAFHAPRSAKSTPIAPHDNWRGIRMTWDATEHSEAKPQTSTQPTLL